MSTHNEKMFNENYFLTDNIYNIFVERCVTVERCMFRWIMFSNKGVCYWRMIVIRRSQFEINKGYFLGGDYWLHLKTHSIILTVILNKKEKSITLPINDKLKIKDKTIFTCFEKIKLIYQNISWLTWTDSDTGLKQRI